VFHRLGKLDRRPSAAAYFAFRATIGVTALLGIGLYFGRNICVGLNNVAWMPTTVVLIFLPITATAFSEIKAGSDLARLVERSVVTTADGSFALRR
jgi:hypothetical protein